MNSQAQARGEDAIIGKPPRLAPLDVVEGSELAEAIQASMRQLREGVVGAPWDGPVPLTAVPEILTTMIRRPGLWESVCELSVQLMGRGALSARDRELAILRVLWLLQAPFAWGEHVKHGHKAGITSEEIDRVTLGAAASGWGEHERAILAAVEELHATAAISDATWQALSRGLSEEQLLELPILVGQFTMVAYLQNGLRLRLGAGNIGLRAR